MKNAASCENQCELQNAVIIGISNAHGGPDPTRPGPRPPEGRDRQKSLPLRERGRDSARTGRGRPGPARPPARRARDSENDRPEERSPRGGPSRAGRFSPPRGKPETPPLETALARGIDGRVTRRARGRPPRRGPRPPETEAPHRGATDSHDARPPGGERTGPSGPGTDGHPREGTARLPDSARGNERSGKTDRTEPRTGTGPPSSRPARPGGDSPPPEVAGARLPPLARRPFRESAVRTVTFRPQVGREDPLDLSISLSGGKETNQDSPSSGERSGKSPAPNPRAPAGAREVWREEVRVPAEPRRRSPLERGCRSSGAGVRPMRARGEAGAGPPGVGLFCNAAQRRVVNSIQG